MILIYSSKYDLSSKRVERKLSCKAQFYTLFIDDYPISQSDFSIENNELRNCTGLDLLDFSTIYFRLLIFPVLPNSSMPEMYKDFLNRELGSLFLGQLMALEAKWVNDPFYAHIAGYKLKQLKWANESTDSRFCVPDTCISNDRNILFNFYQMRKKQGKRLVTKAIHSGYIQSKNSDEDEAIFTQEAVIDSIDAIPENQPLLLQEKIEADYEIRCFVIGEKVLSAKLKIPDDCVDYRGADISLIQAEPITLPQPIERSCINMTKRFCLEYSAIDLLYRDGKYFFLDFNSTGDWIWYEDNAGLPISEEIANLLAS